MGCVSEVSPTADMYQRCDAHRMCGGRRRWDLHDSRKNMGQSFRLTAKPFLDSVEVCAFKNICPITPIRCFATRGGGGG